MPDTFQSEQSSPGGGSEDRPDPAVEFFYDRTLHRIGVFIGVIGAVASLVTAVLLGWRMGVGVLLGCVMGAVNFVWLKQAIHTIGEKAAGGEQAPSGRASVAKSVLRYGLIGVAAYGIFLVSRQSLYGFLGGLFVAVAAILFEAGYEAYVALRHGL